MVWNVKKTLLCGIITAEFAFLIQNIKVKEKLIKQN
jgi:hypothetical protein